MKSVNHEACYIGRSLSTPCLCYTNMNYSALGLDCNIALGKLFIAHAAMFKVIYGTF